MGKTKTAFVTAAPEEEKSGKAAYEEKRRKQEEERKKREALDVKKAVKGVGLKGGERVKIVDTGPIATEESTSAEPESTKANQRKIRARGEKYKTARAKIDKNKKYTPSEAIKLIKDISFSTFDGTVELHLVTKKTGFSENVNLPYSTGSSKKVEIAGETTLKKLKEGKIDFDILLATPAMMPKLVSFAKVLGPKGLMPNPKNGTLIKSKSDAKKFSANSLVVKTEKSQPVIHTIIGKVSQKESELEANLQAIVSVIGKKQIEKAYIKATMSPSVKLEI